MKRLLGLLLAAAIVVMPGLASAKSYHFSSGRSHSYRTYSSKSYGSVHVRSYRSYKAPTFKSSYSSHKIGSGWSGTYKTTGFPKVKRSESARHQFLKSAGYDNTPSGYEVDHVVPLSRGGSDSPSNMQLLPASVHHAKTAREQSR